MSTAQAITTQASPWRDWLTSNGGALLLFARKQTRSQADAEDILQEALVKLARKVEEGSFFGGQEAWLPFLYTQIRREAIDLGRKEDRRKKREEFVAEDEKVIGTPNDDEWFEAEHDDEIKALLARELKALPQKFAEVIMLKIWGKRTFADIGEVLGISLNTAASRYRYGLEALKRQLAGAHLRGDL